jgi:hypothetical protein
MNDPLCPQRDDARHVCADKFGDVWDRPVSGPRSGSHCFLADRARVLLPAHGTDERAEMGCFCRACLGTAGAWPREKRMAALGALLASTMPDPDDEDLCETDR